MYFGAKAFLVGVLALALMGCKEGNSADGELIFGGSATGDLNQSPYIEFLEWKKKVHIRMAPASTFDVSVADPKTRSVLEVSSLSVDSAIATAQVVAPGLVRVVAVQPGEANLRMQVQLNGKSVEDVLPLVVEAPNRMALAASCPDQPYWVGHPAVVSYSLFKEPRPSDAKYDSRIFGSGYTPLAKPFPKVLHQNGFEWVFSGLDAPGQTMLTGELLSEDAPAVLTMEFENPPKVNGLGLIGVGGWVLGPAPELQGPIGSKHAFRAFPVGEDGQQMCNTAAAAQVVALGAGCVVRSLDSDSVAFGQTTKSPLGLFEVAADSTIHKCTFEVTLEREGWVFASDVPIRAALTVSFFPVD